MRLNVTLLLLLLLEEEIRPKKFRHFRATAQERKIQTTSSRAHSQNLTSSFYPKKRRK